MRAWLLLFILLPVAGAVPHHQDYERVQSTEDVLRVMGQRVLDESALSIDALLQGGAIQAASHAKNAKEDGERLGALQGYAFNDPNFPQLLLLLGPAAEITGASIHTIALGGIALDFRLVSVSQAALYHQDIMAAFIALPSALDAYDALGYDTSQLRQALARTVDAYEDYVFVSGPPELSSERVRTIYGNSGPGRNTTAGGAAGIGGGLSNDINGNGIPDHLEPELDANNNGIPDYQEAFGGIGEGFGEGFNSLNLVIEPARPYFGQTVTLALFDPEHAESEVTMEVFGQTITSTLNRQGVATLEVQVPWNAPLGYTIVTTTWDRGSYPVAINVLKVPTQFQNGIIAPPDVRIFLLDAEDRPVTSEVLWRSGNETGNGTTGTDGLLNIKVPPALGGNLRYLGNATHQGTVFPWGKQEGNFLEGGEGEELPEDLFRAVLVNVNEPGGANALAIPDENTALARFFLWSMVAFLVVEVLLSLRRSSVTYQTPEPEPLEQVLEPEDPVTRALHPLLELLRKQGIQPESLTLREAAVHWDRMGAPVHPWLENYEHAVYTGGDRRIPLDLLQWARIRL